MNRYAENINTPIVLLVFLTVVFILFFLVTWIDKRRMEKKLKNFNRTPKIKLPKNLQL